MMTTLPPSTLRSPSFPPSLTPLSSPTSLALPPPLAPPPASPLSTSCPSTPSTTSSTTRSTSPPTWPHRLRLALHIAASLAALNSLQPPITHRDVKPSNLLLDAHSRARLAVRLPPPQTIPPADTLGYLDPSYLRPIGLSIATDVYSFGVVLLEILTGRRAIDVEYSPPSLVNWAAPLVQVGWSAELWDVRAWLAEGHEEAAARDVAVLATRCIASVYGGGGGGALGITGWLDGLTG